MREGIYVKIWLDELVRNFGFAARGGHIDGLGQRSSENRLNRLDSLVGRLG